MLEIREADQRDLNIIIPLAIRSFREAFESKTDPTELQKYLDKAFNRKAFLEAMATKGTKFFIADYDGQAAGYLKLRDDRQPKGHENQKALEIERMYVLERFYRMKIGSRIMEFIHDYARQRGYELIWLGVWQENPRAIQFYEAWGFERFGTKLFEFGDSTTEDYLYKKKV